MAESSVTKEYDVLQKRFERLTDAIGDTGILIAGSCFGTNLISRVTLDLATLNTATLSMRNGDLLKGILSAVVTSPDNLMKFIWILEKFPPLDIIAMEMKRDLESPQINEVPSIPQPSAHITKKPIEVDQDVYDEYCRMRDKLGELVYKVKNAIQSANVDIDDLRGFLILKNILNDAVVSKLEEANSLLAIFQVVCRDLCSPINITVLNDIAYRYRLPESVIKAINLYEIDQKFFHLKLNSAKFADMLKKEVELTGRDPKATEATITIKLAQADHETPLKVSEFKKILDKVFQEFARYIHVLGAKDGCVCVTLYAPKAVMGALVAMGKRHIPYLIDAGVISLIIGGKTIINNITDKEEEESGVNSDEMPSLMSGLNPQVLLRQVVDNKDREISHLKQIHEDLRRELHQKDLQLAECYKKIISFEKDNKLELQSKIQPAEDETMTRELSSELNEGVSKLDHHEKANITEHTTTYDGSEMIPPALSSDLTNATKSTATKDDDGIDKLIPTSKEWRCLHTDIPVDAMIIGSFGYTTSNRQVCPKIIPSQLKTSMKWMDDEMDGIVQLYENNPDKFHVKHTCHDVPGNEYSKQHYLELIQELFENSHKERIVIWYTGHGEKDTGNWCFKDGVITFHEIFDLYMKHIKGKRLSIKSDCSYSGNWIKMCAMKLDDLGIPSCGHHTRQHGILLGVFTSCGADEEATALTYINEGLVYSPPDDGISHYNKKTLSSGQTCQLVNFTRICCSQPPNESCEVDEMCTWEDRVFNKAHRVYTVRGKDRGSAAWHVVLVDEDKLEAFKEKVASGRIDVADYGQVLYSGWGKDPPQDIDRKIDVRFSHYVKPK